MEQGWLDGAITQQAVTVQRPQHYNLEGLCQLGKHTRLQLLSQ